MTISKELLLAILAMDSYNRGYEPGMENLGGAGSKIGDATFKVNPAGTNLDAWQASGFYASSYVLSDGSIVISYRGSDDLLDAWNDFQAVAASGLGVIPHQAELAARFYQSVRAAHPDAKIVVTGHSLGGALAGIVGKIYGLEAHAFNNISFENVAKNIYDLAALTDDDVQAMSQIGGDWQSARAYARDGFGLFCKSGDNDNWVKWGVAA